MIDVHDSLSRINKDEKVTIDNSNELKSSLNKIQLLCSSMIHTNENEEKFKYYFIYRESMNKDDTNGNVCNREQNQQNEAKRGKLIM